MDKKFIKQLVQASVTNKKLDAKKVEKIASLLQRKELRAYIRALKIYLNQTTVYINTAQEPKESTKKTFSTLFSDKNIVYTVDPALLLGAKIVDNDIVYEMNLQNKLQNIVTTIEKNYDR